MKNIFRNAVMILFLVTLLAGCNSKEKIPLPEELAQMIGNNLEKWLDKMPLEGKLPKPEKDKITFDNSEQVFPFIGNFINEKGESPRRQTEVTFYKNPSFGDSFAYAALLYEPQEVFLKQSYMVSGNIVFDANPLNTKHYAELSETYAYEKNASYKSILYVVWANYRNYLSGVYCKDNLILQFAFPYDDETIDASIEKIKDINEVLNLNVKKWEKLKKSDLAINKNPVSFWKGP